MVLTLRLENPVVRVVALLAALAVCYGLGTQVQAHYLIQTLAEQDVKVAPPALLQAVQRWPASARLQAQLAAVTLTRMQDFEESLQVAENAAQRAVNLAPYQADYRMILAATQSVNGNQAAQAEHLRAAVALAPHYPMVRWQLANVLVRAGQVEAALPEFRQVVTARPALLPQALDLLWNVAPANPDVLAQATGELPQNKTTLAQFLFQQNHPTAAAQVFQQLENSAQWALPSAAGFLNALLTRGQPELARSLWAEMRGAPTDGSLLVWNGSFETERALQPTPFDWQLKRSAYANVGLEMNVAHTGTRALRLDFAGRDTTKLTDEVRQLLVLRPLTNYRLEAYAKAARLVTPVGPRFALLHHATGQVIATTQAVSADAPDWQRLSMEFTTPAAQSLYWLTLQRTPQFSYDEPTQGTIWFDDVTLVPASADRPDKPNRQ